MNGLGLMNKKLFCFGFGKVATQLSLKLLQQGWKVNGTCRGNEKKDLLEGMGFSAKVFFPPDIIPDIKDDLANSSHILASIPPSDEGCLSIKYYNKILESLKGKKWLGYISSTSVYGHYGKEWVDEFSKPITKTTIGLNRLLAEGQWEKMSSQNETILQIFRVGGIYGPKRNQIHKYRNPSEKNYIIYDDIKFNRIHQDDLVGVILASFKENQKNNIFNVVDDEPASMNEQAKFICKILNVPLPKFVKLNDLKLTGKKQEFYKERKLVKNNLIKEKLGYELIYPSYREGLKAIIDKDT